MNTPQRSRKQNQRNVFRRSHKASARSSTRQLVEALLMLSSGLILFFILNWLPSKYDAEKVIYQAWGDLLTGLTHIFEAAIAFIAVFLTILLIIICIALLLGGIWRLIKVTSKKILLSKKKIKY